MKILAIHADFIEFQPEKKALKGAEEVEKGKKRVEECLVIFTAVEKRDEIDLVKALEQYLHEIKDIAGRVKAKNIVLYPYAHLSSQLSAPKKAEELMKEAEKKLAKDYKVTRAPFGWYKSFTLACKGHPLSELSREFGVESNPQFSDSWDARMETASHLVYETARKMLNEEFISISEVKGNKSTLNWKSFKAKMDNSFLAKLEIEVNKNLHADLPLTIGSLPREEALKKCGKFYDSVVPQKFKEVRVVTIKGLPPEPCIHEHVSSTKKIGDRIIIEGFEKVETEYYQIKINVADKELTSEEIKQLLKQISKSKLDASQLKENDHRIIGQKLNLWSFNEVASGMVFWHDKGLLIKNQLIDYWREVHRKAGYQEISTPQIMDKNLWLLSGHWSKFKENMFITNYEKRDFAVKPMNCPGGMLVYKSSPKSYKDLPLRVGELGVVHRQELSGVLSGLFRVIQFTQDDAHIFCTEEQIESEIIDVIELFKKMLGKFEFKDYKFTLSVRSEEKKDKYLGSDERWGKAEKALSDALKKLKIKFEVNKGEAKFYGPSLDILIKDSLGREWQCSTLQLDFNLPQRFDIKYTGKDNKEYAPIMLHRVVYGSLERFIGIITEHLNGNFPLWLNPNQIKIVTITDRSDSFAKEVKEKLDLVGLRVELDNRTETLGKKVREAQLAKFNYIITIGDKEVEKKKLAIRTRKGEVKFGVEVDKFIEQLLEEVKNRD